MNGFADHGLNDGDFGDSKGLSVRSFDAFPKTKQTYLTRTRNGHVWTSALTLLTCYLVTTEIRRWMTGTTSHAFSVEKGVAHTLQLNLDIVMPMACTDLHVNIQDAAGDRIVAGQALQKDPTQWNLWVGPDGKGLGSANAGWGARGSDHGGREERGRGGWEAQQRAQYEHEEDVHDYLGAAARRSKRFRSTPRVRGTPDACRIFGSLEGNKVQGDFHITARGHGYMEMGEHLDHTTFNFSHHINELSFGPFYPTLLNPLDSTTALTPTPSNHFHKFQYYLSVVPTVYTDSLSALTSLAPPSSADTHFNYAQFAPHTIFTNQYAVTEQSRAVPETTVPGVFVKYDIEPILLTVSEEWGGFLALVVRCVNVVAGVLVAGGWVFSLVEWVGEIWGRRKRSRGGSEGGLLHGGAGEKAGLD